ncbi:MAG: hypothetical protein HETSPECPRED_001777 [Heterodermia speciosa]|uniref:F-box domain-containing protein n=1 Tax=Heterodermia speciosa TaxID=116794 RepID=A0A8H3J2G4_9LECA|nr:MAG: hypothetical protein HETSPECPRED_001777 [Heterodermia speciosa]
MPAATRSRRPLNGRSSRPRSHRKSYREASTSDEDDTGSDSTPDDHTISPRPRPAPRTHPPRPDPADAHPNPRKRKAVASPVSRSRDKKAKIDARDMTAQNDKEDGGISIGARMPPWQTLPYHILVQVFEYAAWPLVEDYINPSQSIPWLLRAARVCKAFAEPAISALYYSPPLSPPYRARGLLAHLQAQDHSSMFNYRAKVKYLDIDSSATLYRKHWGNEPIDIKELVAVVPKLRGMGMHRVVDIPKFNKLIDINNNSSKSIHVLRHAVSALQEQKPLLREWKWSVPASDHRNTLDLHKIHRSVPFQNLTKLTLVEFDSKGSNGKGHEKAEEELAKAISALPSLEYLELVLCNDVNAKLLPLLPKGLQELEIVDCPIDSKMLAPFLASHGQNLRRLVLDHNQSLNLAFIVDLEKSCPVLEVLKMDLTYYNAHFAFSDLEPRFEDLLSFGQIPTWPASLRDLELIHLRKWENETANDFFTSLVDAAGDLVNLRRLIIKASLTESSWRERVNFRDRWTARLEKVFLRKPGPPNPHLTSIAAFKAERARYRNGVTSTKTIRTVKVLVPVTRSEQALPASLPTRSQRRHRDTVAKINESSSDSERPTLTRRRSSRLAHDDSEAYTSQTTPPRRQRRRPRIRHSNGDSSSEEDSALEEDIISQPRTNGSPTSMDLSPVDDATVIQGMCDVVRIQINNLRPTEEHLAEDDFLDAELSGDGDWDGDDAMDDGDGYAW